jgi:co-chaperonin GroES (HSP10)
MKIRKLLSDCILVRLEPLKKKTAGGIIKPDTAVDPVWIGKALMAGPGKHYRDRFIPMEVEVGERVAFMAAATDGHSPGMALLHHLSDDERIIRQGDVLFVVTGKTVITK